MRERICILMSTYNGERFILEQLSSLFSQKVDADILIYIRDDGSQDKTIERIKQFRAIKDSDIEIIFSKGNNVGVHRSFLEVLYSAPEADYYAFCDQDDYWKDNKLQIALSYLYDKQEPALFYSGYEVVDHSLKHICNESITGQTSTSVIQILFQNRVPGCVMVFNRQLRCEIMKARSVESVRMHDGYVLCIAYITGIILHDHRCLIQYRQHSSNALGYRSKHKSVKDWIKEKFKLLREGDGYDMACVAGCLYNTFGNVCTEKQKSDLKMISEYKHVFLQKLHLLSSRDIRSVSNKSSTISIFCRILFNVI